MRRVVFAAAVVAVGASIGCDEKTITQFVFPVALTVAPSDTTIPQGGSVQLRVTVLDTAGREIPNVPVAFTSGDTTIAKVSASGHVTSRGPAGTVFIVAKFGTLQDGAVVRIVDSSVVARLSLRDAPHGAAIAGNGVVYVTRAAGSALERLDVPSRTFTASVGVGAVPTRVIFDATGNTAYVSNQLSQTVGVVNVATSTQTETIPVPGDPVPVRLSGNGQWLYVATNVNRLYKINRATRQRTDSVTLPATSHFTLLHPNDVLLYVATREGGTVMELNVSTWTVQRTFTIGGWTQGMALSPDRAELYVANEALSRVDVINLTTGSVAASVPLRGGGFGLALSADGAKMYVSLPGRGEVQVINRTGRSILKTINVAGVPREIVVHAGTGLAVVPNEFGWVDLLR